MIDITSAQSNLDNLTALVGKDTQDMPEIRKRVAQARSDIEYATMRSLTSSPYYAVRYAHRAKEWQNQLDNALAKVKL